MLFPFLMVVGWLPEICIFSFETDIARNSTLSPVNVWEKGFEEGVP
jgi:hypothetical protein